MAKNDLARLVVRLEAENAKLHSKLDESQRSIERFEKSTKDSLGRFEGSFAKAGEAVTSFVKVIPVLAAGVATVKFASLAKDAIDMADQMSKASAKVGITTESLSALNYAAQLSDVQTEDLIKSMQFLDKALVAAQKSGSDMQLAFSAMGVSTKDSAGHIRAADDVLNDLADAFKELPDGALKTDAAIKIFGKSGAGMINLLNGGADGLRQFKAEAERLGVVISSDTGKAAEAFNDSITRLKNSMMGMVYDVLPPLLSGLNDLMKSFGYGDRSTNDLTRTMNMTDELIKLNVQYKAQVLSLQSAQAAASKGNENAAKAVTQYGTAANDTLKKIKDLEQAVAKLNHAQGVPSQVNTKKLTAALSGETAKGDAKGYDPWDVSDIMKAEFERVARQQKQRQQALGSLHNYLDQQVDMIQSSLMTQQEREEESYKRRQQIIEESYQREIISKKTHDAIMEKLEKDHKDNLAALDEEEKLRRAQVVGDLFGAMAQLAQTGGAKHFQAWKNLARAQAIVDTYVAANNAMAHTPGPPWVQFAAAAAVVASGLARVTMINKTNIADTSGGVPVGGGIAGGGNTPPVVPGTAGTQGKMGGGVVQVVINGSETATFSRGQVDQLMQAIEDAITNGDKVLINKNSRQALELIQ